MLKKIVVWDPEGKFAEGELPPEQLWAQLAARGVVLLPVETDLFKLSGCGGYFSRHWGAGYPMDQVNLRNFCPATLFCQRDFRGLHWAARLLPEASTLKNMDEGLPVGAGQIRITGDSSQPYAQPAQLTPVTGAVDVRGLGKPDARGGWTIGGKAQLHPAVDGYYAFALYGAAVGFRVSWLALSLTPTV